MLFVQVSALAWDDDQYDDEAATAANSLSSCLPALWFALALLALF